MNFVPRRFLIAPKYWAPWVLALLMTAAPVLLPLCRGAQAGKMARHACCAGAQSCHTQVGRAPCCELQGAPGGGPMIPAPASASQQPPPLLQAWALPEMLPAPALRPVLVLRDAEQAQAPPLYLAKRSFLC